MDDEEFNEFTIKQQDNFPTIAEKFGWHFGSPQNYFAASADIYGFGLLTKNEKVRKTGVLIITSSVTTGVIQTFSKTLFGRARPSTNVGVYFLKPFSGQAEYSRFLLDIPF